MRLLKSRTIRCLIVAAIAALCSYFGLYPLASKLVELGFIGLAGYYRARPNWEPSLQHPAYYKRL